MTIFKVKISSKANFSAQNPNVNNYQWIFCRILILSLKLVIFFIIFLHSFLKILCHVQIMGQGQSSSRARAARSSTSWWTPATRCSGPSRSTRIATRRIWIRRIQCLLLSGMIQTRAWKLGRPIPTVLFILTYCFKFFALNFFINNPSLPLLLFNHYTHNRHTHTHRN